MQQNRVTGALNFTLPTNNAKSEEDVDNTEQMKEVGMDCDDVDASSSNTLSVSAVDEDDLRMLN